MSTEENTVLMERLQERMTAMLPKLTPGIVMDYERFLAENDLEGAENYVSGLEHAYDAMRDAENPEEPENEDDL